MARANIFRGLAGVFALLAMAPAWAASPTSLNVTVYETEVCNDGGCTTILEETAGVSADLVSGTGAFGERSGIPAGSYDRFRFTIANQGTFSGDNTACSKTTIATDQPFLIDGTQGDTAQVTVSFATADATPPGSTSWYANGSDTHPFLMTAPIIVEEGATTDVSLQFNTADTLGCDGSGDITIAPPTFSVSSHVESAGGDFTGGDYWLMGVSVHAGSLTAVTDYGAGDIIADEYPDGPVATGERLPPYVSSTGESAYGILLSDPTHGDEYRAQMRVRTTREVRWGMKVRFNPPDSSGAGTADVLRNPGKHRHSVVAGDDNFTAADNSDAGSVIETVDYEIDSHNRLNVYMTDGRIIRGALTPDYETFLLAEVDDGVGFTMGVQVTSGAASLADGLYAWNNYDLEIERDDDDTGTTCSADGAGENGDECLRTTYASSVAWLDLDATGLTMDSLRSKVSIDDPETTSPGITTEDHDESELGTRAHYSLDSLADGAGYVGPDANQWLAQAPSKDMAIMAGETTDLDPNETTANLYRHRLAYFMLPRLSTGAEAIGIHTRSSLAGTYFLAGMWDERTTGDVAFGATVGEVVLNADGTGTLSGQDIDNLRTVSAVSDSFAWDVVTFCLGVEPDGSGGYVRLDPRDPVRLESCSPEGRLIDVVKVVDPSVADIADASTADTKAILFVSRDGSVLSYLDPRSLDTTVDGRSLGNAIRLQ